MKRRKRNETSRLIGIGLRVIVTLLICLGSTWAQDPAPSSASSTSAGHPDQQQDASSTGVVQTPDTERQSQGGSGALPAGRSVFGSSSLRWGPLSLASFDTLYVYDSNYLFSDQNATSAEGAAVRAVIEFYVKRRSAEFSIRYSPFFSVFNGATQSNFASNSLDLGTYKRLNPRWTLSVNDQFLSTPNQGRLTEFTFTPDFSTGQSSQSPYLATGQKLLENNFQVTADYAMSAYDRFSVPVRYEYVRLTQDASTTPTPTNLLDQENNIFGIGFDWSHNWSKESSMTLGYSYDRQYFSTSLGTAQYHSMMATYRRMLRPTLRVQLQAGPSVLIPGPPKLPNVPIPNTFTYQASAALFKNFRESELSFSWSRNHEFTGVLTDQYHDRFDLYYSRRLNRRLSGTVGGGYIRQQITGSQILSGATAWGEAQYLLNPNWSVVTSYMFLDATGGGLSSATTRHVIAAGVRGSWSRVGR